MNPAVIVLVMALAWATITGTFTAPNLLLGAAIGVGAVVLLRGSLAKTGGLRRLRNITSLAALFFYELIVSAIRVAIIVLSPDLKAALRPAIVAFPLSVKSDAEITLLANLITLTPGTLSVDVSEDRTVLYVHALNVSTPEALIAEIATGFEARVREVYA